MSKNLEGSWTESAGTAQDEKVGYNLLEPTIMPPKIRKLKAALSRAGFYSRSAKGSHTLWRHPIFPELRVIISGKDGNDAQQYQVDEVREALRRVGKDL